MYHGHEPHDEHGTQLASQDTQRNSALNGEYSSYNVHKEWKYQTHETCEQRQEHSEVPTLKEQMTMNEVEPLQQSMRIEPLIRMEWEIYREAAHEQAHIQT